MDTLLSGIGIFICVGAAILVLLAVVGFRAITAGRDRDLLRNAEQAQMDDQEITSPDDFASVPATGGAQLYDTDQNGIPDDAERRQHREDDDDVPPTGGF